MGIGKLGDGQKPSNRPKQKAPCQPSTLGDGFFMLPRKVLTSDAWRGLGVHARAVLIEIGTRHTGFNNGQIGADQRALRQALGCSPRKVVQAIAELMDHGFLDVTVEGRWTEKMAREYRITFYSTKSAAATNDYLRWTPTKAKSSATDAVTAKHHPATDAVTARPKPATNAVTAKITEWRKSADPVSQTPVVSVTDAVAHILKPYPPAQPRQRRGDDGSSESPLTAAGDRSAVATDEHRACEHCGTEFEMARPDRAYTRRFCSDRCQRANQAKRAYHRKLHGDDAVSVGAVLGANVHRLIAGGRA